MYSIKVSFFLCRRKPTTGLLTEINLSKSWLMKDSNPSRNGCKCWHLPPRLFLLFEFGEQYEKVECEQFLFESNFLVNCSFEKPIDLFHWYLKRNRKTGEKREFVGRACEVCKFHFLFLLFFRSYYFHPLRSTSRVIIKEKKPRKTYEV